jgi:hypothetical protein
LRQSMTEEYWEKWRSLMICAVEWRVCRRGDDQVP